MQAVTCAILAPSGPSRSRLLSALYKDDRTRALPHMAVLEAVHFGHFLRKEGPLVTFREMLMPHHFALLPDGRTTTYDRAILEHNLSCASNVYSQVSVDALAQRMGFEVDVVEEAITAMVKEGRVKGEIDQVEGCISFFDESEEERKENDVNTTIHEWDQGVREVCQRVEACVELIKDKHAEWFTERARQIQAS
jgi:COP9 signalosome complex subunit 4